MASLLSTCAALSLAAIVGFSASAATDDPPPQSQSPSPELLQASAARRAAAAAVSAGNLPETAVPDRDAAAIAALRARGPAGLAAILREYDAAPAGKKAALAATVDAVAAQRYATSARLYWYTDLAAAQVEARRSGKPILALRMLGRLDEDLSCANSRFFRTALYPNRQVAELLRAQFVLVWTSERQVPRVSIDYGDGRALVGTVTGNSIHYVLDGEGRVLDALPGLYAPSVFAAELRTAAALAAELRELPPEAAAPRLASFLEERRASIWRAFDRATDAVVDPQARRLFGQGEAATALARAQRVTVGKAAVEVPLLAQIAAGTDPGTIDAGDLARWASIGQAMFGIGEVHLEPRGPNVANAPGARPEGREGREGREGPEGREGRMGRMDRQQPRVAAPPARPRPPAVLDAAARTLVAAVSASSLSGLTPAAPAASGAPGELSAGDALLARFEQRIVADTAMNQLLLRPQLLAVLAAQPGRSLDELNRFVYDTLFATPSADPWLGLLPRDEYTGLPGDGALVR